MVNNMDPEYFYTEADESELDKLLSGNGGTTAGTMWTTWSKPSPPRLGSTGVVWMRAESPDEPARPLALISHDEDIRRLCGRYAQLHSDLSPLTAWCHLLTPQFLGQLQSLVRIPDLGGMQAAWTGLVVAEAVLLAERPLASVRISACLATQTFAIGRSKALWNPVSIDEISKRFDAANRLCRIETTGQKGDIRVGKLRASLQPIWETLIALSQGHNAPKSAELEPVITALQALRRARSDQDKQEARHLMRPLLAYAPEADTFEQFSDLTPELRLRLFDKLVEGLGDTQSERTSRRRNALAVLAGYLATVAAGGKPSLTLAETHASRWPEITAWAYLIGGIGENVVWTSSFDGLGRLVARELLRPLRLDEPPTCDFSFDEAAVLADSKLVDPLVHLRVKQARLVTVGLFPGVNISIPIAESSAHGAGKPDANRPPRAPEVRIPDPLAAFADALWPHIRARIEDYLRSSPNSDLATQEDEGSQRSRGKRRSGSQPQLPLSNPRKY
jgi:hypothetical protein